VCCSMLQCIAVSCSSVQCIAVSCRMLQCVDTHYTPALWLGGVGVAAVQ